MPSVPNSGSAPPPAPSWNTAPAGQVTEYGGFWIRLLAYLIDGIVLNVAFWIVALIVGIKLIPADPSTVDPAELVREMGKLQIAALALTWLYFALMESSARGATFISSLILFIGYLMVAFTDRKRGLHDMIAGTLVIKVP